MSHQKATTHANKGEAQRPPKRKYDTEFKQQALQLIRLGQSVRSVAQTLGISENLLHQWKAQALGQPHPLEQEVAELRAKLRLVEQERDILKKAVAIFSRQH